MEFTDIIQSFGFPVAAFCALFYMIETELKSLRTSLDNNTNIITRLYEKMGGSEDDGN